MYNVCTEICFCQCVCLCVCLCLYVYVCVCDSVCMVVFVYVCICICVCVCFSVKRGKCIQYIEITIRKRKITLTHRYNLKMIH